MITAIVAVVAPPVVVFLVALAFLLPFALVRPYFAMAVAICLEATRLIPELTGFPSFFVTGTISLLLVAGVLGTVLRTPSPAKWYLAPILLLLAITGAGTIIQILSSTLLHVTTTANLLLAPLLAVWIACGLSRDDLSRVLRVAIVLLVANAVACIWQLSVGGDALIALGLEYGSVVRHIDGVLRTPGLTLSSATVGMLSAAVMLALSLLGPDRLISMAWTAGGLLSGGIVLVLSTSRSGVILFVLGTLIGHAVLQSGRAATMRSSRGWKILAIVLAASVPLAMVRYGASSIKSLFDRFAVWSSLAENHVSFWGLGAGRVGASSYSDGNPFAPIFVDNSWLSLLIQYGFIGFFVAVGAYASALLWALRRTLSGSGHGGRLSGLLIAAGASGLLIEILDYTGCMIVIAVTGTFLSREARHPPDENNATASQDHTLSRRHPRGTRC